VKGEAIVFGNLGLPFRVSEASSEAKSNHLAFEAFDPHYLLRHSVSSLSNAKSLLRYTVPEKHSPSIIWATSSSQMGKVWGHAWRMWMEGIVSKLELRPTT
jgi:hypothetical protein